MTNPKNEKEKEKIPGRKLKTGNIKLLKTGYLNITSFCLQYNLH